MGGSASSSPAVQRSLANFMDAAMSTTVDGLRSTGKRIKKGNAALSNAMSDAYDEVNLLDPARQIGLTSQGRGDPSIMRSINTPLVAGAQMGLGAANAAYRGTANLLGQGVEGVRSALPKSLSDYVGTGAQFERDFNAMPEFLAGTGFGLIPASVPPIAKGFAEGTAVRNAERGMVKLTDDLPMTGGIPTKSDLIKARQIVEDAAKRHGLEMSPTAGGGEPGWGGGMTNSKYASFRASAPDGKKFTNIDVRVSDHGEPMKRLQSGYGSNLSFDGSQSLDDFAAKTNDLFSSVSAKYKPNDLPMDEASRMAPTTPRIRGYHGSPHEFDEFDLSKIGSGEGAQAYGHGLYIAEEEKVAKSYKDALTQAKYKYMGNTADASAALTKIIGNKEAADSMLYLAYEGGYLPNKSIVKFFKPDADDLVDLSEFAKNKEVKKIIDEYVRVPSKGHMYEVDIHGDPAKFLDWDKSLNEQPKALQEYLAKRDAEMWNPNGQDYDAKETGQSIYRRLHELAIKSGKAEPAKIKEAQMVNDLRASDVPGIKYLDQGSRVAGDGSRNYVVFDPKTIEILRKYGLLGGMVGAGALADNDAKASSLSAFVGEKDDTPFDRLKRKFKGAK